jgi:hypothetical protein
MLPNRRPTWKVLAVCKRAWLQHEDHEIGRLAPGRLPVFLAKNSKMHAQKFKKTGF